MTDFTCALCGRTFHNDQSEDELVAQLADEFPGHSVEDCERVCDDCFQKHFGSGMSVSRWAELNSDPLRDLQRTIDEIMSPTCRQAQEPEMQRIDARTLGTDVHIMFFGGWDFGDIEARMLALMLDPEVSRIVLDFETMRLPGTRDDFFLIPGHTQLAAMFAREHKVSDVRPAPSYLKHDPTKNHRKRKRR